MNYIEILNKVVAYESTHNVEDYIVEGWHVWPLLRCAIFINWLHPVPHNQSLVRKYFGSTSLLGKHFVPLRRYLAYLKCIHKSRRADLHKTDESNNHHPIDVIFMTLSERRVFVDNSFFEIYTDPFVDLLRELGFSSLVWEEGNGCHPQYNKSEKIMSKLNAETARLSRIPKEPDWFAHYKILVGNVIGREIAWGEISTMILAVTNKSIVFERWLRKANAQYLFLVCWYNPIAMSAIMAAKRCGVKTIDIQHGVQGKGHFAYSSWLRAPSKGYEVVPNMFWCWGKTSVEELQEFNPAFSAKASAISGGNLWINRWRQPAKQSISAIKRTENQHGDFKKILVTLQRDVPKLLLEAISISPLSWMWLLRFHPSRSKKHRDSDMCLCLKTGHPGLEFERSNESLLYTLLNDCDVHVTESSSCSLEALVFGVPSVILESSEVGETGKFYYRQFIERKLMFSVDTARDLINTINSATMIDQSNQAIMDIFADNHSAKALLNLLLRNSGTKGNTILGEQT